MKALGLFQRLFLVAILSLGIGTLTVSHLYAATTDAMSAADMEQMTHDMTGGHDDEEAEEGDGTTTSSSGTGGSSTSTATASGDGTTADTSHDATHDATDSEGTTTSSDSAPTGDALNLSEPAPDASLESGLPGDPNAAAVSNETLAVPAGDILDAPDAGLDTGATLDEGALPVSEGATLPEGDTAPAGETGLASDASAAGAGAVDTGTAATAFDSGDGAIDGCILPQADHATLQTQLDESASNLAGGVAPEGSQPEGAVSGDATASQQDVSRAASVITSAAREMLSLMENSATGGEEGGNAPAVNFTQIMEGTLAAFQGELPADVQAHLEQGFQNFTRMFEEAPSGGGAAMPEGAMPPEAMAFLSNPDMMSQFAVMALNMGDNPRSAEMMTTMMQGAMAFMERAMEHHGDHPEGMPGPFPGMMLGNEGAPMMPVFSMAGMPEGMPMPMFFMPGLAGGEGFHTPGEFHGAPQDFVAAFLGGPGTAPEFLGPVTAFIDPSTISHDNLVNTVLSQVVGPGFVPQDLVSGAIAHFFVNGQQLNVAQTATFVSGTAQLPAPHEVHYQVTQDGTHNALEIVAVHDLSGGHVDHTAAVEAGITAAGRNPDHIDFPA